MRLDGKGPAAVFLRQASGYGLLLVGVIGCILPIMPGIPFLIAGLGLLAVDCPWAARLRDRLLALVRRKAKATTP